MKICKRGGRNIVNYSKFLSRPYRATSNEIEMLKQIAEYQFGYDIAEQLFPNNLNFLIQRSLNTRKIRNILTEKNEIYLVLRARDMLFSITPISAKVIKDNTKSPRYRVIIPSTIEKFIREGRNVFAKHVIAVDSSIRSGDEVIIVNENDKLIALGKAKLSGEEMLEYKKGVAVYVKRGVNDE